MAGNVSMSPDRDDGHHAQRAGGALRNRQRGAAGCDEALDKERAAIDADAARVASQVIADAGKQARLLVREALLLTMGLALVILGLPFAAGYWLAGPVASMIPNSP